MSPRSGKSDVPYVNHNYLLDTKYVVRVAETLLTPIGIWPRYGVNSPISNFLNYIWVCFVFCLMMFMLAPHFIWTFFKAQDLRKLIKIISAIVFGFQAVLKFWTLILNKQDILHCLEVIESDYKAVKCEEDRQIMIKNAKIGRLFTMAYLGLMYCGALPYHIIMPFLADRVLKSDNTTMLPLPYPSEYGFFIVENSPLYEIVFVTEMLASTIILMINTGVYGLIICIVIHSCCLFEITSRQVEFLLRNKVARKDGMDSEFTKNLAKIIDFHVHAIE